MGGTESELSTGVHVMTRRELHEKISETFEPKPNKEADFQITVSNGGFWWPGFTDDWNDLVWLTYRYDTDEAANAMLLEAMPEPELWIESSPGEPKRWGCVAEVNGLVSEIYAENPDRKIAIVDAYAKWKNIE